MVSGGVTKAGYPLCKALPLAQTLMRAPRFYDLRMYVLGWENGGVRRARVLASMCSPRCCERHQVPQVLSVMGVWDG
jgi:hypothetical protein